MIVEPYRRNPLPPRVALLLDSGRAVAEDGQVVDLDDWPDGYRLWASYETVYSLVREGKGEALCWRGEEIRWRHRRFEQGWKSRVSDAAVVKLPFSQLRPEAQLAGFVAWRDWLASYGASPAGTTGSAAWSLLRATLPTKLITNSGERPPLRFTVGGRQALGPHGQGAYLGPLAHLDLPAAYASELAGLRYGGIWLEGDEAVPARSIERFAGAAPVFVRARVRVPEGLAFGPLVRRPRRPPRSWAESAFLSAHYPTGTTLQGVWTWEEVEQARACGCSVKLLGGWVHRGGTFPFAPWWLAIQAGRELGGLPGALAKATGNALWGRFALEPGGQRSIRSQKGNRLVARVLAPRRGQWPAHDLAETVSGRVRARLHAAMLAAGDGLVCAHTDGLWTAGAVEIDGWRVKEKARRLELLDPQVLRYWRPRRAQADVVYAGVPAELAAEMFERKWNAAALEPRGYVNT